MAEPQQPPANTQQQPPPSVAQPVVPNQQMTSKTPATKQKNPKRQAAGKATAEKTRLAREAQRNALIEAHSTIAQMKQAKSADPPSAAEPPSVADLPSVADPPSTKNVLTTTQWLGIISIVVSLAGVYYKREEIKNTFSKKATPPPRTPPPSPVDAAPTGRIMRMD